MKSLNKSSELWTNMSAKEVENSNYAAQCCFNVKVNKSIESSDERSGDDKSR